MLLLLLVLEVVVANPSTRTLPRLLLVCPPAVRVAQVQEVFRVVRVALVHVHVHLLPLLVRQPDEGAVVGAVGLVARQVDYREDDDDDEDDDGDDDAGYGAAGEGGVDVVYG